MPGGGGGATDQDRHRELGVLELLGHLHHLLQARRDQPREADHVHLVADRLLKDLVAGHHHAQVDHVVAVAAEHHAHDVLADVVHVALDRRHQDLAPRLIRRARGGLLGLHEGQQVGDGPLHDPGALHDLRQEHLPLAEQVPHRLHALHQRPLDDLEAGGVLLPGFLHVHFDVVGDPLDQGVGQPLLDAAVSPGVGGGHLGRVAGLEGLGEGHEPLGGVGPPIEEHVLDFFLELGLDLLIDRQLPGVDDPHLHSGPDRVVEEAGVHRLPDGVVAPERERDVGDAPRDLDRRHRLFDPPRGLDEVLGVGVVLLDPGGHREDVGVEDDVFGREANDLGQEPVGPLADRHPPLDVGRLPLLVEGHHHHGRPVAADRAGLPEERLLPLLQADRVDDPLALDALQPRLEHLEPRGVDHDRDLRHLRLAGEEREEFGHHLHAVEHPLVDVDVDDVGPVLHLLAGDAQGLLVPLLLDEPGEGPRSRHVCPLPHDREARLGGADLVHLEARIAAAPRRRGGLPGRVFRHHVGDRLDVGGRGAAAAPHDVDPAGLGELLEHARHHLGGLVEAAQGVGQPGVGVDAHRDRGDRRQVGHVGPELLGAEGAVDAHAQEVEVLEAGPAGLDRLGGEGAAPLEDRERGHHGDPHARVGKHLLDRVEAALEHERVEGRLGEEHVHAPLDERLDLLPIGGHHLVEGHVAVAGVGHVAGDRELLVGGADRAGHEPGPGRILGFRGRGGLAGQLGGGQVQLPRVFLEAEVGERHARGAEGAGLDDVAAGGEVGGVDPADRVGLGER